MANWHFLCAKIEKYDSSGSKFSSGIMKVGNCNSKENGISLRNFC